MDDTGKGAGTGFNLNIPWQRGSHTDADYIAAFDLVSSSCKALEEQDHPVLPVLVQQMTVHAAVECVLVPRYCPSARSIVGSILHMRGCSTDCKGVHMSRQCAKSLLHSTRAGTYDGREGPRRDGSLYISPL